MLKNNIFIVIILTVLIGLPAGIGVAWWFSRSSSRAYIPETVKQNNNNRATSNASRSELGSDLQDQNGGNDDLEEYEEEEITPGKLEELARNMLDEIAAHPEDPDNPSYVQGVTDEELEMLDANDIEEMFELCLPFAEEHLDEPRYMFALGRAALLHGYEEADVLLSEAADAGSAASYAYLAMLTDDIEKVIFYLNNAIKGGFEPARTLLKKVEGSNDQNMSINDLLAKFRFSDPEMMKAFYSKDISYWNRNRSKVEWYIKYFAETLEGTLDFYSHTGIHLLIDADMAATNSTRIGKNGMSKAFSIFSPNNSTKPAIPDDSIFNPDNITKPINPDDINNPMDLHLNSFSIFFNLMRDPIGTTQKTMDAERNIKINENRATVDAKKFISLYEQDKVAATRIYEGMKEFVYNNSR